MKFQNNRTAAILIVALLTISIGASMTLVIPNVSAHTPVWKIPTYAFINAEPNPVGVGQKINVIMWIDKIPDGAAVGNSIRWHNYNLVITKPDGTKETQTFTTVQDTTSAQFTSYTPSQTGNYTFTFTFPEQQYTYTGLIAGFFGPPTPSSYVNDTYLTSSASTTVEVQQDQITAISSYPLPSDYWTRPIYAENTDWYTISSNWLGTGSPWFTTENSYTNKAIPGAVGSQTGHIMWTKPLQSGGLVGGTDYSVQGVNFFEGSAYINRYTNPIIMDGKLYYNEPLSFSTGNTVPTVCVDLRTGQLIWSRSDVSVPSFGIMPNVPPNDPNQHGVFPPMLVAQTGGFNFFAGTNTPAVWVIYDADTGNWIMNVTNVPSGSAAMGPDGEYLIYSLTNQGSFTHPSYYLSEWNFTRMLYTSAGFLSPVTSDYTYDGSASADYDWNVSVSALNTMVTAPTQVVAYSNDVLLCYSGTLPSGGSPAAFGRYSEDPYTYFALNLNAANGVLGSRIWSNTFQPPAGNITVFWAGADPVSRIFVESYKETSQWVAYSLDTGAKLWGPVGNEKALDYYGNDFGGVPCAQLAYGNLYYSGFGGTIYCYDSKTGNLKWTYGNGETGNSTNSGAYTGYGVYPTFITAIGNGVIYTETTEHTILNPIYKGALTRAVNATDGTEIWTLSAYTGGGGGSTSYAIADGFATFLNGYDNQIYVVGRGPSALTVSAPNIAVASGVPVIVSGTVMDVSAGTKQNAQASAFANGVPVASDDSMKDWMGYVYQQKPMPTSFKGVPVTIDVLDSNGNYRNIGTATTTSSGTYSLIWTPDISGSYQVIATFHGTNGYWGSYSQATFDVMNAPATTAAPTSTPVSTSEQYFVPAIAGLFVLVIVGFAVLALLMLRKRP